MWPLLRRVFRFLYLTFAVVAAVIGGGVVILIVFAWFAMIPNSREMAQLSSRIQQTVSHLSPNETVRIELPTFRPGDKVLIVRVPSFKVDTPPGTSDKVKKAIQSHVPDSSGESGTHWYLIRNERLAGRIMFDNCSLYAPGYVYVPETLMDEPVPTVIEPHHRRLVIKCEDDSRRRCESERVWNARCVARYIGLE